MEFNSSRGRGGGGHGCGCFGGRKETGRGSHRGGCGGDGRQTSINGIIVSDSNRTFEPNEWDAIGNDGCSSVLQRCDHSNAQHNQG